MSRWAKKALTDRILADWHQRVDAMRESQRLASELSAALRARVYTPVPEVPPPPPDHARRTAELRRLRQLVDDLSAAITDYGIDLEPELTLTLASLRACQRALNLVNEQ